jgi:hypothetical protein
MGSRVSEDADRIDLTRCLLEGLRLAHTYRLDAPWLSDAGRLVDRSGGLTSIQYLGSSDTHAGALSKLLGCKATLHQHAYRDRPARIDDCMAPNLASVDRFWLRSVQASSWMSAGELPTAERIYREILADPEPGALGDEAFTMHALLFLKRGAFADLLNYVDAHRDRINEYRLRGDVFRFNAQWDAAAAEYARGLRQADADGDSGLAALFRAELALVDGWRGDVDPRRWVVDTGGDRAPWDEVATHIATALYLATRDRPAAIRRLDRAATAASQFGFEEAAADVLVARAFVNAISFDADELAHCRLLVDSFVQRSGTYASWREVIDIWGDASVDTDGVQWLSGAHENWRATLSRRREST